ncbi:hypothetical protein [Hymenobacter cavernae]|uniref:STAS/SEC14 domain-containing protein n=1 Tax=Hymenobacter cavernae TaxID=2044852 RepID=A0ABQ1U1V6_9BACT|nr:hypothetical protein [Hymenobacter cavernae]GGF09167.1 hypothetical protein GCM10011383_20440 [Hymenobacter cavernae]
MLALRYPTHESLYFHNSLASIIEHSFGYVRIDWHPVVIRSGELHEVYGQVLTLLRESGLNRILSDHQLRAPLMPDDQRWIVTDWVPRAVRECGYARGALMQAHDVISQLTNRRITDQLPDRPLIRYFDDLHLAERWLLEA